MIVGSRGSALSLAQVDLFEKTAAMSFDREIITTEGDEDQQTPIEEMGGKSVFCNAVEKELLDENIDVAIHSFKDMPGEKTEGLLVVAVLPRNDPTDCLIGEITPGCVVGTSSPRRKAQIKNKFKDVEVKDIRGNVETRIDKWRDGEYDAIVLASAGLNLLNIDVGQKTLDTIPAICQGIIAIQVREDDQHRKHEMININHYDTWLNALMERELLVEIGGDCHTALAGHATQHTFKAEMFEDGKHSGIIEFEAPFGGWGMAQKLREGLDSSPG